MPPGWLKRIFGRKPKTGTDLPSNLTRAQYAAWKSKQLGIPTNPPRTLPSQSQLPPQKPGSKRPFSLKPTPQQQKPDTRGIRPGW